ncbi:hypothetical protein UFOVP144_8 [uncultured Caudovirales phage]|uniref:Uncharacterized protein n=1 Tax=uncultured Caudovirales phage TaxID=2100421 RepID=A0A6J7XLG7_9CAUD|nr:hypothetical protein UFOVP144_8 [uncultured Caudovirales phage]
MSPTPPPSNEEYASLIKDGTIAAALGAAGMVSRMLLSPEPLTLGWIVRRLLASGLVSIFAGFALQDHITSLSLRYACIGLAGASAPELLDAGIAWAKNKANAEVSKTKPNGKRKRK